MQLQELFPHHDMKSMIRVCREALPSLPAVAETETRAVYSKDGITMTVEPHVLGGVSVTMVGKLPLWKTILFIVIGVVFFWSLVAPAIAIGLWLMGRAAYYGSMKLWMKKLKTAADQLELEQHRKSIAQTPAEASE